MTEVRKEAEVHVLIVTKNRDAKDVAAELSQLSGLLYWDITTGVHDIIAVVRLRDISYRDELRDACLAIKGIEQVEVVLVTASSRDETTTRAHAWFP